MGFVRNRVKKNNNWPARKLISPRGELPRGAKKPPWGPGGFFPPPFGLAFGPEPGVPGGYRLLAPCPRETGSGFHATCTELTRLGVQVEEHADGMTIHPCERMQPANVQTYNDHRMAMAFSLIGLRFDGVTIENPECVSKTFPNYFEVLDVLR